MIPCGERCGERVSWFCKAESRDRSTKRPRAATVRPAHRAAHAPEEEGGGRSHTDSGTLRRMVAPRAKWTPRLGFLDTSKGASPIGRDRILSRTTIPHEKNWRDTFRGMGNKLVGVALPRNVHRPPKKSKKKILTVNYELNVNSNHMLFCGKIFPGRNIPN